MGGGGGGGRGLTPDELKSLQQKAKKSLKDGDGTDKCNVFISFSSDDLDEVNLLRGQAKNENSDIGFNNDWSLKKPFDSKEADYIKRGIRERIRQCRLRSYTSQIKQLVANGLIGKFERASQWGKVSSLCIKAIAHRLDYQKPSLKTRFTLSLGTKRH